MDASQHLLALTQALADPLRLMILQELMGGPATVSELTALTDASQPNVSNHLALLRERELVRATRQGRQVVYELRDPAVAQLVEALAAVAGPTTPASTRKSPLVRARTCYDHLAGRLGVAIFDALVSRDALHTSSTTGGPTKSRAVELGAAGAALFADIGIDIADVRREKRQFAYACLDWTERRPHVGGALGAALWMASLEHGWVLRQPGTRGVILTEAGRRELSARLGAQIEEASA